MKEAASRETPKGGFRIRFGSFRTAAVALLLLAAFELAACSRGGAGLGPAGSAGGEGGGGATLLPTTGGGGSSSAGTPGSGIPAGGTPAGAPRNPRPLFLEPIVEERSPSASSRALGEDDLRSLGELSILPHVVQSISSGAPCDLTDAMSHCQ